MKIGNHSIEVLPAGYGDSIFLSLMRDSREYNILIDGGIAKTYFDAKNKKKQKGPLKQLLDELKEEGRCVDLLVVTHIDDDHIAGICKWFEMDFPDSNFVKQIWMNDDIQIDDIRSLNNSASNAMSVVTKLRANGVEYRNDIVKGVVHTNDFCRIRVLTPKTDYRNVIAQKIAYSLDNAADVDEMQLLNIKELIKQKWIMAKLSDENKASIAFELETWDGKKMLMLGDAEYDDFASGLKFFHNDEHGRLMFDLVKLSHHGSKNNFHPNLLGLIHSTYYVVSGDGKRFGHPDKEVLAQIVDKTDSYILFNYESRKKVMFNEQDFIDYPDLENRVGII